MSGKILVVDPITTNRLILKVKLSSAQYNVITAANGEEALSLCFKEQPDLVLMDVQLQDVNGVDVCRAIKENIASRDILIVLLTTVNDNAIRLDGLQAGADDFLYKPIDEVTLLARVRSLLRNGNTISELGLKKTTYAELGFYEPEEIFHKQAEITIVGASDNQSAKWKEIIGSTLSDKINIASKHSVLNNQNKRKVPDVFVIAIDIESTNDGLRLMSDLRSRSAFRHSALIMVLPRSDSERAATALDLGAWDICYEPFLADEIGVRVLAQMARKRRADKLRLSLGDSLQMALFDPLTGFYNRRYGLNQLNRIAAESKRNKEETIISMIDIDHFKRVNDTYGHKMGDMVLSRLAEVMRKMMRKDDFICRIGGEEFLVVMSNTTMDEALEMSEKLRQKISQTEFEASDDRTIKITASFGIAELSAFGFNIDDALSSVDNALYRAKFRGRNCISTLPNDQRNEGVV